MPKKFQLFNKFADSGSYYDICLQIFHLADYRNAADIKATWQHLIQDLHANTVAKGSSRPWEAVIEKIRSLGNRLRLSETVFPIRELVPILERYSLEHNREIGNTPWVVNLFIELGIPHESLYAVLEAMWYTDEAPFQGSNRRLVAYDLLYVVQVWLYETTRVGGVPLGSQSVSERVSETMTLLQQQGGNAEIKEQALTLRRAIAEVLQ